MIVLRPAGGSGAAFLQRRRRRINRSRFPSEAVMLRAAFTTRMFAVNSETKLDQGLSSAPSFAPGCLLAPFLEQIVGITLLPRFYLVSSPPDHPGGRHSTRQAHHLGTARERNSGAEALSAVDGERWVSWQQKGKGLGATKLGA